MIRFAMPCARAFVLSLLLLSSASARADEPITLRMAVVAPDGSGWSRELRALAREIETLTHGSVLMKWYFGGIAGDELRALGRIRRGQLDGEAGALFCSTLSSTMNMTRVAGLVRNREEALYLLNRLRQPIDADFRRAGFEPLVVVNLGNDIMFLRHEINTFAQLQKTPMWIWDEDKLLRSQMATMGLTMIPGTLEGLLPMFDAGRIDGMFVIPTAALAFQWTTRARYFIALQGSTLPACLVVTQKAFDQLTLEQQRAVRAASASFAVRFEELGKREDALLLHGLLEKQGVRRLVASEALRSAFLGAAAIGRNHLDDKTLPIETLKQAMSMLAEYREQQRAR